MLSFGQAVKAIILNGLGLTSAPLYFFKSFFVSKATEHLLGEGNEYYIKPWNEARSILYRNFT